MVQKIISSMVFGVAMVSSVSAFAKEGVLLGDLVRMLSNYPAISAKKLEQLSADKLVTSAWSPPTSFA